MSRSPFHGVAVAEDELNQFLASHRVIAVDRQKYGPSFLKILRASPPVSPPLIPLAAPAAPGT